MDFFLEAAPLAVGAGEVVTAGGERKSTEGLLQVHKGQVKGLVLGSDLYRSSVDKLKI